jgi:proline iminopeptidase
MTDVKLAPNLPQWMKDHVALYQSSGGKEGHMYTTTCPTCRRSPCRRCC